jgi:serine/threonine-protein kinase
MNPRNFLTELKRRNVYKVTVAYAVVAWLLIQAASILFPTFEAPVWVMRVFVAVVALGFPIALVLAWVFEMTSQGIVRTDDTVVEAPIRRGGRAWIYVVMVGAAISIGLFFLGRYTASSTARASGAGDKSIAVLPLVNQSGDPAQEYFSDGLTEELINGLGQIAELRVIGRNSCFRFKGKGDDSRAVGQALGVANLLEGSVRTVGDRIRIGVQLVNAADGSQRWSETYNRELKDIFAVQEEIAKSVADQLRVTLLGTAPPVSSKPSNQNLAAYNAYLQGQYYFGMANREALEKAISFLDEAIRLDPDYAQAYVLKARSLYFIEAVQGVQGRQRFEQARVAAKTALTLQPNLSTAHAAMAYIHMFTDWDLAAAEAELSAAGEKTAPVINNLANLRSLQGRMDEAISLRKQVILLDPVHAPLLSESREHPNQSPSARRS